MQNLLHTVGRTQKINDDGVDELTGRRCEGFGMQTGFLYSDPGHPFVSHCLEMIYDDGRRSYEPLIIDAALIWALKDFDPAFRFSDQTQRLRDDTLVWNSRVYTMRDFVTSDSVAIHWYDQSWMNYDTLPEKLRRFIRHRLYFLIRRKPGMPFDGHFQ